MTGTGGIRLAVIGAGSWGTRAHLPNFAKRPDVEVTALVDPRREAVEAAAQQYGVRHIYTDAEQMFQEVGRLDAVVLATPTDTHCRLVRAAVQRGAHVLCEKPLAYTVTEAREMVDALHAANRVGKVGFLFRYSPVVERMRQLVRDGYIGDVQLFESIVLNAQFMNPTAPLHWKMQRARANGGVFVEYGVHSIDLALWFGGPITSVVAHGATLVPARHHDGTNVPVDVDDVSSWIATYASGAEGVFRTGWASLPVGGGGLRVYGTKGSLAWHLDPTTRRSERLLVATVEHPEPRVEFEFAPPYDPATDAGIHPLGLLARYNARLDASFVDDIREGRTSGPTFDDGLAAQRVLAAIRTSLDERRWVDVDET